MRTTFPDTAGTKKKKKKTIAARRNFVLPAEVYTEAAYNALQLQHFIYLFIVRPRPCTLYFYTKLPLPPNICTKSYNHSRHSEQASSKLALAALVKSLTLFAVFQLIWCRHLCSYPLLVALPIAQYLLQADTHCGFLLPREHDRDFASLYRQYWLLIPSLLLTCVAREFDTLLAETTFGIKMHVTLLTSLVQTHMNHLSGLFVIELTHLVRVKYTCCAAPVMAIT